jgi:endonuclease/exonuclease/phosphatase family metal-dependent hydrolase
VYIGHANGHQFNALIRELSEFFVLVDSSYDTRDKNMPSGVPTVDGNNASYGNPESILIRKSKLRVVDSGWRYLSDGTQYHGIHWAILEVVSSGKQFIASVGHYGDTRKKTTYAEEHLAAIAFAQKCSGSGTTLPTILTGDMYTYVNHSASSAGAGYRYLDSHGYDDSQVSAVINCNTVNGTLHGTFHDIGIVETDRASEDFVWYNDGFEALKFKVLVDTEITNSSDHYPVCADLKFK